MPRAVRKIGLGAGAACMLLLLVTACSGTGAPSPAGRPSSQTSASYPISLQNCGRKLTIASPPKRVVSLWQSNTEALLALGLRDKIVATQQAYSPYPRSVAKLAAGLKTIGSNTSFPSKEALLSEQPDFVTGQVLDGFAFDTSQGYASVAQLQQNGATVYGANLCSSKDAQNTKRWNIDSVSKTLRDYGKIFGVSAKADAVIDRLDAEKEKVVAAAKGEKPVKTAYFNGGTGPLIVLAGGIYDDLISTAGGKNVFPADAVYVSKEAFASSGAEVILVGTFPGQSFSAEKEFLQKTFPDVPAVRTGRIEEVPTRETDSSISVMVGLTKIANALHPGLGLTIPSS